MDTATGRKLETVKCKFTVVEIGEGRGINHVTLKPQFDHSLGDNQLLSSGQSIDNWVIPVPQNINLFEKGRTYYMEVTREGTYTPK